MTLYHASKCRYAPNEEVKLKEGEHSLFYNNANEDQRIVIDLFDEYISATHLGIPPRKNAQFAFEKEIYAYWYCRDCFIYEIEMDYYFKGPFVLVDEVRKNLRDERKVDALLSEYYQPSLSIDNNSDWIVYEYLGESFRVVRQCELHSMVIDNFTADREKASRLFGDAHKGTHGILA